MTCTITDASIFYELIRVSIEPTKISNDSSLMSQKKGLSKVPNSNEWGEIYLMAKSHAILGICFSGLQWLYIEKPEQVENLPRDLRRKWLGEVARIQAQNELLNRRCIELRHNMDDCGLKSCVLKGQGVAMLYPESLHNLRQSGDIDIWIEGAIDDTVGKIRSLGVNVHDVHLVHAVAEFFNDVVVEVHFTPSWMYNPWANQKLQTFFKEQIDAQFVNHDKYAGYSYPSVYFQLIHSLVHINRHVFEEGVGFRQLIDLYFILKNSAENERARAYDFLCTIGLRKFVAAVMYVEQYVFNIDESLLLCEPDETIGSRLLEDILVRGNFGQALGQRKVNNKLEKGFLQLRHNIKYLFPYVSEVVWIPLFQLWHWVWRKCKGYI